MKELLFKLDLIVPTVVLLLAVVFLKIRKRMPSFSDLILLTFLFVQIILNTTAAVLQDMKSSNLWVYHLNCFISQLIFTYFFFTVLRNKKLIYLGAVSFCMVYLIMVLNIQSHTSFPSYTYSFASFIIMLYGLRFLNDLIETLPTVEILSLKEFWLLAGVLTYFGSAFFIFISYSYLSLVAPKKVYILWQFHNIFLSFGCILFFKAITSDKWIPK